MSTPITVLTGFLGAGKTTLLNHALSLPAFAHTLVIVNEVGEIPLDHLLVREVREDVIVLPSGCVCCSLRGDLVDVLSAQRPAPGQPGWARVLVETTGLADPTPILATLVQHPTLSELFHLDRLVAVVDAQLALETLPVHDEAQKQVALADQLVVTKTDLVDSARLARVLLALRGLNAQAGLHRASHGLLDWSRLLDGATGAHWEGPTLPVALPDPHPGPAVRAFAVSVPAAVEFGPFALWLSLMTQLHGAGLLRLKGLLRVKHETGPLVVQSVQHVVYPTLVLPRWPSEDERSRVVVITRGLDLDMVTALKASLRAVMGAGNLREPHHHAHHHGPPPSSPTEEALR